VVLFEIFPKPGGRFGASFTATGIAPVFHRSSLFILIICIRNQIIANLGIELFCTRRVFRRETMVNGGWLSSSIFDTSFYVPDVKPSYMEYGEIRD
jgi:hypothetical protein